MPSKGDTQINTFVGGLITEASPLSFPPNASLDEINFKLKRDGSRERRLGIDYEDGYTLHATGFTSTQMQRSRQRFFRWPTPSGSRKVEIGVIQVGNELFFVDLFQASPSSNLLNGATGITFGTTLEAVFDFAIINSELLVVSEELDVPSLLTYDDVNDIVNVSSARVLIRDLYGVDDGLTIDERPTSLTPDHKYNLRNQGWSENIVSTCGVDALDCTFQELEYYPSNADTWSLGKIADVTDADVDKYDPETLSKNSFDLGRASRGHYIIDLYDRGEGRTTESEEPVTKADRELGRISTVATYAGRGFYSGIRSRTLDGDQFSPNLGGAVFFSQVLRSPIDLIKCYQEADPTSPEQNDIVDTDGGIIQVPGAVNIIKLMPVKTSLFVFATNGVWEIRGDDGGFRATSFQVNKISSIGVFSRESIIEANGTIMFWAKEGIFALSPDQFGTSYDATNLTMSTIQKGYDALPNLIKQSARGYYDVSNNTVRWLFKSDFDETIVIPDPPPPVFETGGVEVLSASAGALHGVSLTATKYILAHNNSTTSWDVAVVNVSGTAITIGTPQVIVSSVGSVSTNIKVARLSDNSFVMFSNASTDANKVRIITLDASDNITVSSPLTVTFTSTFLFSDLTAVSATEAVISSYVVATGAIRFLPLDLSSGTPVAGTEILSAFTALGPPRMEPITGSRAIVNARSKAFGISVTASITEDGSALDTSGQLTQAGALDIHKFDDGTVQINNAAQSAVVTQGNPPTFVANMEGGINIVMSQGDMHTAGSFNTRYGVVYAFNSGISSRAMRLSIIIQAPDGDADTIPSLTTEGDPLQLLDDDTGTNNSSITTDNLGVGLNKFWWASVDAFSLDIKTQVITLGS